MDYKKFALRLAQEAGKIIKRNFALGMKKEWQKDTSPLTETDLAVNKLVIGSIKKEFPEHTILAEEGNHFSKRSEYVWVCDPVDGTIPFSHGIPICVFSLALVRNGDSILGVIYDPFMDRMFFADKGGGAFMNGQKIHVSSRDVIKNSLFGLANWRAAQFNLSQLIEALKNESAHLMNVNSIAYMGALVANGEFTGTIFPGAKPHDTAALKVIVEEAGGRVTDLFGNEQRYDMDLRGHLVSNGAIHKKLLNLIRVNVSPARN